MRERRDRRATAAARLVRPHARAHDACVSQRLITLNSGLKVPFDLSKGEEGLPMEFPVLKWGENATAKGRVVVNETTVKQLAAYNKAQNWDLPYLDFNHSTVPGTPCFKEEPIAIAASGAGWRCTPEEGLVIKLAAYTPEGKKYAGGGHYRDVSAVVVVDDQDRVIGFHSAALCRHGAAEGMQFFSAPWPMKQESLPANAEDLLRALKDALNLGQEATPATVLQTLNALMKTEESTTANKPAEPDVKALSATLAEQSETLKALAAEVKALRSDNEAAERAVIEAQCAREGKVIPASAKDLPVAKLKALAAELPVTVPLEARTPHEGAVLLHSHSTAQEDSISKLTGVTAEMRAKYKA